MYDNRMAARLPPDVLIEVFTYYIPEEPIYRSSRSSYAMRLSRVCRAWRGPALSHGPLWAGIRVDAWKMPKGIAELVELWFSRAGNSLVDVHIGARELLEYTEEKRRLFDRMLDALSLYHDRVGAFEGIFPPHFAAKVGINNMLNATSVSYHCYEYSSGPEPILDVGPQRDTLRRLKIYGCPVDVDSVVAQTWLTHLSIYSTVGTTGLALSSSNDRVHFPDLNGLSFTSSGGGGVTFLDRICTPSLEGLDVDADERFSDNRNLDIIRRFQVASQAPIQALTLSGFGFSMPPHVIVNCLAPFKAVQDLRLGGLEGVEDAFFRAMTLGTWDVDLLPNLKYLHFSLNDEFSDSALMSFLNSRTPQLKFVGIDCVELDPEEIMELTEGCGIDIKAEGWSQSFG